MKTMKKLLWWRRSGFPSLLSALAYDIGYWFEAGRHEWLAGRE